MVNGDKISFRIDSIFRKIAYCKKFAHLWLEVNKEESAHHHCDLMFECILCREFLCFPNI